MHIHRAVVAGIGIAPHLIHELFAAEHTARMLHQKLQQVVLLGGQLDGPAVPDGHALLRVKGYLAYGQQAAALLALGLCAAAAQKSAYTRF